MSIHQLIKSKPLSDFAQARLSRKPGEQLRIVREAAQKFRSWFINEPEVVFYKSVNLVRVPYPIRLSYHGPFARSTLLLPSLLHLLNKLFIIQYRDFEGVIRTLLFSPSDQDGGASTPFFVRLAQAFPKKLHPYLAPMYQTVEGALAECGLTPEDVDYISYDHLHAQDLRKWLGANGKPAYFPNARLIVHQQEWLSAADPFPNQTDWYCPGGTSSIDPDRILTFEGDLHLGEGIAFMHTPGHTQGNHSLVCRVQDGIRVTSENGVSADSYAPEKSKCKQIRNYALATGSEVIINGNTQESSVDQYVSMIQEKTVAGPSSNPHFPNCVPSSEVTPFWLLPGKGATHLFGEVTFGEVQKEGKVLNNHILETQEKDLECILTRK